MIKKTIEIVLVLVVAAFLAGATCAGDTIKPYKFEAFDGTKVRAELGTLSDWGKSAALEITRCGPKLPAPSMFSYQAILSSRLDAERMSMSPSPSTSAPKTDRAPSVPA